MNSAAAAKLLQSCSTLCHPIDSSPPGSAVPGILQARALEWVAISFSNAWKWKVKVKSLSRDPMDCSPPASSVHGIFQTRVLKWVAIAFSNESLGKTNLINNDIKQICSCPCLELGLLLGQVDRGRFQAIVSFLWFPSLYILCIYCRFMLWCYHEAYIKHVIDTVVHFKLLAI